MAILATIGTFLLTRNGEYAGNLRPAIFYNALLLLYLLLLTGAALRQSWWRAVGSGVALGLAALFEPLTAALIPLSAWQLATSQQSASSDATTSRSQSRAYGRAVLLAVSALACFAAPLALLAAVNVSAQGTAMYAALSLGQRMAFVGLDGHTWAAAIATTLPFLCDIMLLSLPSSEVRKLSPVFLPGSLLYTGASTIFHDAMARSGSSGLASMVLLIREGILARPLDYLVSIPPVMMRGLLACDDLISMVGLFHVRRMFAFAHVASRTAILSLVLLPIAVLFVLNTMLTANGEQLNAMLPFVYAYAIVYVASGW